jgi:hypothetical protein
MADSEVSQPIKLDADAVFLSLEMHGHQFEVDLWDAGERLAEIDRKHAQDPKGCQNFLDSVVELLRERYGVSRCSLRGAWQFYSLIVGKEEELKKTISQTPESPTGSESTAEAGPAGSSASDSTTCSDATPSEICASLI